MLKLDFDERDLRSLRVFCHVAEVGGFAAAEKRLLMSKASISRHIRDVETRLGVRLCERGPGGFRLTPEGVVALNLATTALQALNRIRPEIDAAHGILSGPLIIGLGEHTLIHPTCRLPEALSELQRQAPNVQPEIVVMSFKEMDQALHTQHIDIAIRGKYSEDRNFSYLPLYDETHRFYVPSRINRVKDQASLPLVYRPRPYVERALSTGRYKRGPEANALDGVGALVATGHYQRFVTHFLRRFTARTLRPASGISGRVLLPRRLRSHAGVATAQSSGRAVSEHSPHASYQQEKTLMSASCAAIPTHPAATRR